MRVQQATGKVDNHNACGDEESSRPGPRQGARSKRLRKLHKKLREISQLEARVSCQSWSTKEVRDKIAKRAALESEITQLQEVTVESPHASTPRSCSADGELACCVVMNGQAKVVLKQTSPEARLDSSRETVTPPDTAAGSASGIASGSASNEASVSNEASESTPGQHDASEMERISVQPSGHQSVTVQVGKDSCIFRVPKHFELVKLMGHGSYGAVAQFKDTISGQKLAVKKVSNPFHDTSCGLRTLRELRVLRASCHINIVKMHSFYCSHGPSFDDLYMLEELMDTDLSTVIRRSGQQLNDRHHKVLLYGTAQGLYYLHSMDVAHRDLKPANILCNLDCSVKLCDFNLSRGGMYCPETAPTLRAEAELAELSDYVCTRWYRAPEIMIYKGRYGMPIDIWGLGCILGELIGSKPLFKGKNSPDQLKLIIKTLGFPKEDDVETTRLRSGAMRFLSKVSREARARKQEKPLRKLLPQATEEAIALLIDLLQFDQRKRLDMKSCLRHRYFAEFHSPANEVGARAMIDWSFDDSDDVSKAYLWELLHEGADDFSFQPRHAAPVLRGTPWADITDDDDVV